MATINDGELYLEARGANEDQLRRGLAAARAVLDGAGVDYQAAFNAIGTGEPCDTRLAMWESHLEAETIIAESLTSNPNAEVTPAPDPGPHYTIEREALPAA